MAWRTTNVQEQRIKFVVAASRGEQSMTRLCAEFGISRPTGYIWLKRYTRSGVGGIEEKSGRPHQSPQRTTNSVELRVVQLRQQRPDWGARKIQHLLREEGISLPGSTIHRIFLRYDLVRPADRKPAAGQRFERSRPNQLWQMDFK